MYVESLIVVSQIVGGIFYLLLCQIWRPPTLTVSRDIMKNNETVQDFFQVRMLDIIAINTIFTPGYTALALCITFQNHHFEKLIDMMLLLSRRRAHGRKAHPSFSA